MTTASEAVTRDRTPYATAGGAVFAPTGVSATSELEFTCPKAVLTTLVERAGWAVPSREFVPALKAYVVEASESGLSLSATDTTISIRSRTSVCRVAVPGMATLSAERFAKAVKAAPGDEITVAVSGGRASVTSGGVGWELRCPDASQHPGMPVLGNGSSHDVDREALLNGIKTVRYAVGDPNKRADIAMIDVRSSAVTAVDGARVQIARVDVPGDLVTQIPTGAVPTVVRLLECSASDTVRVGTTDTHVELSTEGEWAAFARVAVQFPTERVAGTVAKAVSDARDQVSVDREALTGAVSRVAIAADEEQPTVSLEVSANSGMGRIRVTSRDRYGNHAAEVVSATVSGRDRTVSVNHRYLAQMVGAVSGPTVTLGLGPDTKTRHYPVILVNEDEGSTAVLHQLLADWS